MDMVLLANSLNLYNMLIKANQTITPKMLEDICIHSPHNKTIPKGRIFKPINEDNSAYRVTRKSNKSGPFWYRKEWFDVIE